METATNSSVIHVSAPVRRAGMTESEWQEAIKFDSIFSAWWDV